ncbi:acyl-CoA dehydrogenase family protein [Actinomadura sp. WMMB 499]|uniref:acyl-CoA dehydrogenase family protein n=1 Tax=Actinomadura sp. WMMB 499 TaxID=1219491 RepID=UPI0012469C03|nr:acyl-CoA dehydrogenase family protein [Actinomadura sp. WMMB 499]QFG21638.1 acyl-CoA dehydrogenase [Actinomadura sp. WMMB 499]
MSLAVTTEQEDLRTAVGRFLDARSPVRRARELMAGEVPHDADVWRALAADLGVQGIGVPGEYGGSGVDVQTLAHVFEEAGRVLLPGPLLATLGLAAPLLVAAGDGDAQARYLPGIAAGTTVATVGWLAPGAPWDAVGGAATAVRRPGAGWFVDGRVALVLDGLAADLCLVVADAPAGPSVFAVDAAGPGVDRRRVRALDPTRGLADLVLDGAPGTLVGEEGAGRALLDAALDRACVLLAAETVGAAQACLDASVSYAMRREQFGRPIGSFQAVKHKCAEVLVEIEGARSCARYAAWACGASPEEVPVVAVLAKAAGAEALFRAAAENVQIHGGIGFTWEHDAHLYLKRAKACQVLFGDTRAFRLRLADRLGL